MEKGIKCHIEKEAISAQKTAAQKTFLVGDFWNRSYIIHQSG
jgi:hypothetical protein